MSGEGGSRGMPPLPPPGTFRIDRDGVWRHEGQEVTHPGVLLNLYSNLRVDAQQHYLEVGPARIPVEVEDAPFVVSRVEAETGEDHQAHGFRIYLNDGSAEWLSPASLWIGARETPYCLVKSGRFRARLSVSAWLQLAPFVEEGPEAGGITVRVGRRRYPLLRRD